jgi:hypothetical protein
MTTTKTNGLGWTTLSVADASGTAQDIRTDITNLSFATPRGVQDITGIDKSAHERLLLLSDFTIELDGVFDPGSDMAHEVFSTVPSTSVQRATSIEVAGAILGPVNCLYSAYDLTRAAAGEFTWKTQGALADGAVPTWSGA